MIQTLILVAGGIVVFGGVVAVLVRSRDTDTSDSVPQSVLTRINAEYRDIQ